MSDSNITGVVKFFNSAKGFGFIVRDDKKPDVFVHHSAINVNGFRSLSEGQKVRFDTQESDRGPRAMNVTPI